VRLDTLPCEYPIAHETTQPLTVQTMLGSQEVKKVCMMGQALFSPEEPSNALRAAQSVAGQALGFDVTL